MRTRRVDLVEGCPPEPCEGDPPTHRGQAEWSPEEWRVYRAGGGAPADWQAHKEWQKQEERKYDRSLFGLGGHYETEIGNAVRFLGEELTALGLSPEQVAAGVERISYGLLSVWYQRELWHHIHSDEYSHLDPDERWERALDLLERKFGLELPKERWLLARKKEVRTRSQQ